MLVTFFSLIFGLVTSYDPITENGGLFFAEYLRLKTDLHMGITEEDHHIYEAKMLGAVVKEGLYRRDSTRTGRTVSHDEITGMMVASKILDTPHSESIQQYLDDHLYFYDANGDAPLHTFHPRWIYHWGKLNSRWYADLLFPVAFASLWVTTMNEKNSTSGKLLMYTVLERESFLWQVFKKRMVEQYGVRWVESLFSIYFHTEDSRHPLRHLSKLVSDKDEYENNNDKQRF